MWYQKRVGEFISVHSSSAKLSLIGAIVMASYYMSPADISTYYTNFSTNFWFSLPATTETISNDSLPSSSETIVISSSNITATSTNSSTASPYEDVLTEFTTKLVTDYQKWIFSIIGCLLVGLSGIFPLLLIPTSASGSNCFLTSSSTSGSAKKESASPAVENGVANGVAGGGGLNLSGTGISPKNLKRLLSFAVGSLLGDVFLHLLPEAWEVARGFGLSDHEVYKTLGIWVLLGVVSFLICEMLASQAGEFAGESESDDSAGAELNSKPLTNGSATTAINNVNAKREEAEANRKHIAGYLNLIANSFDNFTHGLAVAGSFIVSPKIGLVTTAAILLHEIPHEIGDFAILLRSGFNPWTAAKAQLSTATIGLLGAIFTLSADSMKTIGDFTWWILPYTSGCFINIALSNLLPDLMKEQDPKESLIQFLSLLFGIVLMGLVTISLGV